MFYSSHLNKHHRQMISKSELKLFSEKNIKVSRIGKKKIPIPENVKLNFNGNCIEAEGPKGKRSLNIDHALKICVEGNEIKLEVQDRTRRTRELHGLNRTLLNNLVVGVSEGFEKSVTLVGVGYRAKMDGRNLNLSVGFSHPVIVELPDGIDASVKQNTNLSISGIDKFEVGNFASTLRKISPPEVYGGKGIRYSDEVIKLKEGKTGRK